MRYRLARLIAALLRRRWRARPLVCPRCRRAQRMLTRWQCRTLDQHGYARCPNDTHKMLPAPHPSDATLVGAR